MPLALERLLARPEGILVNPAECGEIGPDYSARQVPQWSARRSNCFPFRPNGVIGRAAPNQSSQPYAQGPRFNAGIAASSVVRSEKAAGLS